MTATEHLDADAFLMAAQAGNGKDAQKAADAALRDAAPDEKTLAYAVLTYIHTGRNEAAKKALKRLGDAGSDHALWARAAGAVAYEPNDAPDLLRALHATGADTNEYAILSGVSAYQQGHDEIGDQWFHHATINPQSAFATAGALGMRKHATSGGRAIVFRVLAAVAGALVLGIIGLLIGIAAGEASTRRYLRNRTTGPAQALLTIKPPRDHRTNRESLKILGLCAVFAIAIVALLIVAT
ncbi:MAG: hypothetical protein AAF548_19180 [Actinomycetota bacterium]